MNRRVATVALKLLLAASLLGACERERQGVALPAEPTPVVVETLVARPAEADPTAPVTPRPAAKLGNGRRLSATIVAHRRSTVTTKIAGAVQEVLVTEGDVVTAGQLLVRLDPGDQKIGVRHASAAVATARVQVETAQMEADRAAQLMADKAIPARQHDLAQAQLQAALAMLAQAKIGKEMATAALAKTTVQAPYDGVVIRKHANEGDYVFNMPPGPLVTIEETGIVDVRVDVPGNRLSEVPPGTLVEVHVPAVDVRVEAAVAREIPTVNPMTRAGTVVIELPDPPAAIRPGLYAEVRVLGQQTATAQEGATP